MKEKIKKGKVYLITKRGGEQVVARIKGKYIDETEGEALILQEPEAKGYKDIWVLAEKEIKAIEEA